MTDTYDELEEKASRALYEAVNASGIPFRWSWHRAAFRNQASAALEAIGLPALLERVARVDALADKWQAAHDRVCKGTSERIPIGKRHAHDCGMTALSAAWDLRTALKDKK